MGSKQICTLHLCTVEDVKLFGEMRGTSEFFNSFNSVCVCVSSLIFQSLMDGFLGCGSTTIDLGSVAKVS